MIKRSDEPTVIHLTQENIMRELKTIAGAEMLLTDTWREGLRQVRTPFVCLVEADHVLSANYLMSNYNLMKKSTPDPGGPGSGKRAGAGGYTKLAMISSCVGVRSFDNRIYNYHLEQVEFDPLKIWTIQPNRNKLDMKLYHVQVGFVPGAIIRMNAIKDLIDTFDWDHKSLVEMSTALSFHFWNTGRRIQVNPNTTYASNALYLEQPNKFDPQIPDNVAATFTREGLQ